MIIQPTAKLDDIPNTIQEMSSFISRFVLPSSYQKIENLSSFFSNTILQCFKFNEIEMAYFSYIIEQCAEDAIGIKEEKPTVVDKDKQDAKSAKEQNDFRLRNILFSLAVIAKENCVDKQDFDRLSVNFNHIGNNYHTDYLGQLQTRFQAKIGKITLMDICRSLNKLKSPIEPIQIESDLNQKVEKIVETSKTKKKKDKKKQEDSKTDLRINKGKAGGKIQQNTKESDFVADFIQCTQNYDASDSYEKRQDCIKIVNSKPTKQINPVNKEHYNQEAHNSFKTFTSKGD